MFRFLIVFLLLPLLGSAQKYQMFPYIDKSGEELILVWDENTGDSRILFFSKDGYIPMPEQLPKNPLETKSKGKIKMFPYLDKSGTELILVWDESTGKSRLYLFKDKQYKKIKAQLPENPLGKVKGKIGMRPYVDKEGIELILVWDGASGLSKIFTFQNSQYQAIPESLPKDPLK